MALATLAQAPALTEAPTEASSTSQDAAATASPNRFVINLVSSTTPVALTRPDHAGLKRFTFFVSRRREEGRERFRLHMGYFDSQEEAEKLLDIVRGIYPGAWAGLAPGRRLAERAAKAAASAPRAAEVPAAAAVPIPPVAAAAAPLSAVANTRPATGPAVASPPASNTPPTATVATLRSRSARHGRAAAATAPPASTQRARPIPNEIPTLKAAVLTPAAREESPPLAAVPTALALMPDEGRRIVADITESAGAASAQPQTAAHQAARRSLGNIREAIASLDGEATRAPTVNPLPELTAAVIPTVRPPEPAAARTAAEDATLSNSGVLRVLESPDQPPRPAAAAAAAAPVSSVSARPATVPRSPQARAGVEKPYFAVQLVWSVEPLSMSRVPQLAIFNAYTLYGAQGSRDGRRWYGLRLGFFTDAVSAKQVAQYVRSDFATVSVVPVTVRERDQAMHSARPVAAAGAAAIDEAPPRAAAADAMSVPAQLAGPSSARAAALKGSSATSEFKLIDDRASEPLKPKTLQVPRGTGAWRATRPAPGKRAKARKPGQIQARAVVKPKTLEETLEILGANDLDMVDELRQPVKPPAKSSKLSRLFERLSERLGD